MEVILESPEKDRAKIKDKKAVKFTTKYWRIRMIYQRY